MNQKITYEANLTPWNALFRVFSRLFGWGWLMVFGLVLLMDYGSLDAGDSQLFSGYSNFLDSYGAPKLSPVAMGIFCVIVVIALVISIFYRQDYRLIFVGNVLLSLPVVYVQLPVVIRLRGNPDVSLPLDLLEFACCAFIFLIIQLLALAVHRMIVRNAIHSD